MRSGAGAEIIFKKKKIFTLFTVNAVIVEDARMKKSKFLPPMRHFAYCTSTTVIIHL